MKDPYKIEVSERLRLAARESGYTNARMLAAALDLQHPRVRNWMNGTSMPTVADGIRIKELLNVSLDWLYHNDRSSLSVQKWIRLQAVKQGVDPASAWVDDEEEVSTAAPPAPASKAARRRRQKV